MSNGAYPITAGMVYEAVVQGAREATLEALKNVDFSTATGQAQIKAVLDTIAGKDFATQTTLAAVLAKLADLGTELTLDDVKTAAETLAGTVADGAQKVTLTGQKALLLDEVVVWDGTTEEKTISVEMPGHPVDRMMISLLPDRFVPSFFDGGYGRIDSVPLNTDAFTMECMFRGTTPQQTNAIICELVSGTSF